MAAAVCHMDNLEFDAKEMQQLELSELELVESYSVELDIEMELGLSLRQLAHPSDLSGEEIASFRKDENNARQNCGIDETAATSSARAENPAEEPEEFTASMLDPLLDLERESDFDDCSASFSTDALYEDIMGSPSAEAESEVSRRAIPLKDNSGLNRPSRSSSLDSFEQGHSELLNPEDLAHVFKTMPSPVKVGEGPATDSVSGNQQLQSSSTMSSHTSRSVIASPKKSESKKVKSSHAEDVTEAEDITTAELLAAYKQYLERRAKIVKWLEKRPRRVFSKAAQRGRTQKGKVAQKRKRNHLGRFL